ncbi:MAG: cation diffusion facilitator family transporter [Halobacteriota archaeon]|nr:cation diffusion facilitator family transporter [Halobacteriota archaeon]
MHELEHEETHDEDSVERGLKVAIILTTFFMFLEIFGGYVSESLALLSDAGHMFRDVFALVISLFAISISKRLPTKTKTFGFHRVEIFAALINGFFLLIISMLIFFEGYERLISPREVLGAEMFVVAMIGLFVNIYVATRLSGHGHSDLNVRSAYLHVLGDTFSSIGVVIGAIWIYYTGQYFVDPVLSFIIAGIIISTSIGLVKEALTILLEFTPEGLDIDDVISEMKSVDKVKDVHSIHLWSVCSNVNVLDAHVYVSEELVVETGYIIEELNERLKKFNIKHTTFQIECQECEDACTFNEICH